MKRITKFQGAYFLLAIFITLLVSRCLYIHTHVRPDGAVVVHAHPYNKAGDNQPVKEHNHSGAEWLLFAQLALFMGAALLITAILLTCNANLVIETLSAKVVGMRTVPSGRAPPASFS